MTDEPFETRAERAPQPGSTELSPTARPHPGILAALSHLDGLPARLRHSAWPGRPSGDARNGDARWIQAQDELAVVGIECFARHGVLAHERRDGQRFVIDLALGLDTRAAAASDDLHDTVDYGSLVTRVKAAVESDPVDLIETLAERITAVCLTDDRVEWARVSVHKPDAPIAAAFTDATLTITRSNEVRP